MIDVQMLVRALGGDGEIEAETADEKVTVLVTGGGASVFSTWKPDTAKAVQVAARCFHTVHSDAR